MAVALIVAAGRGERLGAGRPKALVELRRAPAAAVVARRARAQSPAIERIVVALPPGVRAPAGTVGVHGGASRSDSVRRALAARCRRASRCSSTTPRGRC